MNIDDLRKPLDFNDIELRVQSINKGKYATLLAYKDARVDMNRLDEVVGALDWKREHFTIGDTMYCRVSILDRSTGQWVTKEDCGTPSMTEKEKGLSSDAFKRACTNWGIGRELYSFPLISVKLDDAEVQEKKGRFALAYGVNLKKWKVRHVNKDGRVFFYVLDEDNNTRYSYEDLSDDATIHNTKRKYKEDKLDKILNLK